MKPKAKLSNIFLSALHGFLAYPVMFVTVIVVMALLMPHLRALRRADVLVYMTRWGFGHTITGPDAARRLFQGKRCVFVVLSEYRLHNWKLASLWPDIHMFFLPYTLGFSWRSRAVAFPLPRWYWRLAPRGLNWLLRRVARPGTPILSVHEMYVQMPCPQDVRDTLDPGTEFWRVDPDSRLRYYNVAHIRLMREVPAPKVQLPSQWRELLQRKLAAAAPSGKVKSCCLYLRQKGADSASAYETRRVGSPLEDYVDSIRLLNQAGYQVLVTGDVYVPSDLVHEFRGMLVDSRALGVNQQLFNLYAATEPDVWVGETGGGTWLPGINGIPRLVLNAFPYFYGYPNSVMFYKYVTDQAGELVPFQELFAHHAYDWDPPGWTVHNNTSREILDAIADFLEEVEGTEGKTAKGEGEFQFPEHTWAWHAGARLSGAWLRRYHGLIPVKGQR